MGHWIYEFKGCPDTGCYQQIANEVEPGEVAVRQRVASPGIVDGFVRESLDDVMMVAHFRWVATGDPSTVMPELLQACGLSPWPDSEGCDVLRKVPPQHTASAFIAAELDRPSKRS
ncbi:hypothetical protein ACWDSL_33435 [Streptomyces sp. NPDC000941]